MEARLRLPTDIDGQGAIGGVTDDDAVGIDAVGHRPDVVGRRCPADDLAPSADRSSHLRHRTDL
jgi:hypothetical protein